jgi:hypothetical protein
MISSGNVVNCAQPTTAPYNPEAFLIAPGERFNPRCGGYVYVVQWGDAGPVKIGQAIDPRLRLAELQCANWNELRLVAVVPFVKEGMAQIIEPAAHALAGEYRLRGEWFDLEPIEAISAVLAAAKHCNIEVWPLVESVARCKLARKEALHSQLQAEDEANRQRLRVQCGWDV